MSPSDTPPPAAQASPGEAIAASVAALARARAECLATGISAEQFSDLLLEEAMLAWLVADWPERKVRERLMRALTEEVKAWFARARVATGQCDCVQEVHLAALVEAEGMQGPKAWSPFRVDEPAQGVKPPRN